MKLLEKCIYLGVSDVILDLQPKYKCGFIL